MIRLGTRGSALARAQSRLVTEQLARLGAPVETVVITTSGDHAASTPPDSSAVGVFVKEIEAALLDGEIDLAVHSLKDMPTETPAELTLGAILPRASALDALICHDRGSTIDDLPAGACIGSGSPRRRAQMLRYRGDLKLEPLRGNVDTRLRRLDAGDFDAIILAHAGLERLGISGARPWVIPAAICLPAPGQGALAVQIRADDDRAAGLVRALDHAATRACVIAERALLRGLRGGCRAAVGALARIKDGGLTLQGMVASPDGVRLLRSAALGSPNEAEALGQALAVDLLSQGAGALIEAAR
jgi:hydroxymethylbilane synthase